MIRPITPDKVVEAKRKSLPDEVISVFNQLIASHWNGYSSTFKQKDVVKSILDKMNTNVLSNTYEINIFQNHWLDVEDIYREAGWIVKYDKPGYNESYDAKFEFRKPSKRDTPMNGAYI